MFVRGSKFILHMLAATLIGFVLISGFLVWQLSRGPISIGFLTPYVEDALTPADAPVRVRLGDTVLTWADEAHTLDVRAVALDIVNEDGSLLASVPEISVRFSVRALLNGLIAPTSLELLGPRLFVIRDADGRFDFNLATGGQPDAGPGPDVAAIVSELLARPDRSRELGYLTRIGIASALVEYEDRGTGMRLVAPRVNLGFERDVEGIRASGSVAVDLEGNPLRFQVSGILSARSGNSEVGLTFTDLKPGALRPLLPQIAFLEGIDIPFNGTVALSFDSQFVLDDVGFNLDSEGGELSLPTLFEAPHRLGDIALRGRARDDFRSISIDEGGFAVDGARVSLIGNLVRRGGALVVDLDAGIRSFPVASVDAWWPPAVEPDGRDWVIANLADGMIEAARINLSGVAPLDDLAAFDVTDLDGRIDATGVTVHYLRPMEPVRGANAVATFDAAGFTIDVTAGGVRGNRIETARILIAGLDGDAQGPRVNVDLNVVGSVRGAFELLDQEPLALMDRVGFAAQQASGNHRTQLIVQLPLIETLSFTDVRVAAASALAGFALESGPLGLPVSDGALSLQVDPEKMIVDGNVAISGVPAGIAWTEWFTAGTPTRRTYQVRAIANDAAREKLGLDTRPWVTGPVGIGLTYAEAGNGVVTGAADLDLTSAAMAVDAIDWRKSAGIPGRAFLRFSGTTDTVHRFDRFSVTAADLVADGDLTLRPGPDGALEPAQVTLNRLAFRGTDIFAAVEFAADGAVDLSLGGRQLDLRREIAALDAAPVADVPEADDADDDPLVRIRISESAPLGTVRLGEHTSLTGLSGTATARGRDVRRASATARLNGAGTLSLDIADAGARRSVRFLSDDGGAVIDALDLTDDQV
ncbi:MAG: DUF3971 domain-containing protein, partial [Alphaproteobacteria bacterium]